MKKYIEIKADTNDADYITERIEITDEELKELEPILKALKFRKDKLNEDRHKNWNEWRHNWVTSEYSRKNEYPSKMYEGILTKEQIKLFNKYVPSGEYGIHTIDSIKILTVVNEEILL